MTYLKHTSKVFVLAWLCVYLVACAQSQKQIGASEPSPEELKKAKAITAFNEAVKLHQDENTNAAINAYEALIEAFPENIEARVNLVLLRLGQLDANSKDRKELIDLLDEVLAIDPAHVQALTLSGVLAREAGKFEVAEEFYRKALNVDSSYQPAILNLAILLDLYRGQLAEALEFYQQVEPNQALPEQKLKDWLFDIKRRIGDS